MKVVLVSEVVIVTVVELIEDVAVAVVLLVVIGLMAGDENEVTVTERPVLPPSKAACSLLVMEAVVSELMLATTVDGSIPELRSRPHQKINLTPRPNPSNPDFKP